MSFQFLLNLFIAFLWVFFNDESYFRFQTFVAGFLVGIVIVFLMRRFFGGRFYLHRLFSVIKLIYVFIVEMILSTVVVIKEIISPKINIKPGIFRYETCLHSDWEITALALLLTLTPGSVVMEVTPEGNVFYIHAMDIERFRGDLERSLARFEKAIMEVTR
ncbi:Na+/H+ antiporter subunit E [Ornithinibacillus sp. 4-3]|uniref:Na+/H+ antiporter subunit E n=1 Tax=Ornithinibacillus sp. 4-3 TaxID=3231488 RepID=A0AB39HR46_9BACI